MDVLKNYEKAEKELFAHVEFIPDWVVCPISDCSSYFWEVDDDEVKYADSIEEFNSDGDYYVDTIYKQRFYSKWVYRGEKYTMIFCCPGVDGMTYFRFFDNTKEQ